MRLGISINLVTNSSGIGRSVVLMLDGYVLTLDGNVLTL